MAFKRKNLADDANGTALGAEELDGDESEGSDLLVADSDDEMGGDLDSVDIEGDGGDLGDGNASGIHNPRQLLAATAALDVRSSRGMSAAGMSNLTMPGVGEDDAGLERRDSFNGGPPHAIGTFPLEEADRWSRFGDVLVGASGDK